MITVADAEYKSFEDVQAIPDPALKHEAVIAWGNFELEKKRKGKQVEKAEDEKKVEEIKAKEEKTEEVLDTETEEKDTEKDTEGEKEEEATNENESESTAQETDTEKTDENKSEESISQETDTEKTEEEKEDIANLKEERAKEYAQRHNVQIDTARNVIEKAWNIKEKFEGNADELALAAFHAQSQYSALQNNLRKQEIMSSNPYRWTDDYVILRNVDANGKLKEERIDKDTVIDAFREKNPEDSDGIDDEAVYKMARRDNENWFKSQIEKNQKIIHETAEKAKNDFITNLPERDKEYLPDFKKAIAGLSSEDIASDENTLFSVLHVVKGMQLDAIKEKHKKELTAAEKRGYERGQKNSKILGEETKKPSGSTPDNSNEKKFNLTEEQKLVAESKYGSFGIPKERMYELYTEELTSRKNRS